MTSGYYCPVCGGQILGDGHTEAFCCENAEVPDDVCPDEGVYLCDDNGIEENKNG